jgi:transcriptional regulator with XRE-family HTH domain
MTVTRVPPTENLNSALFVLLSIEPSVSPYADPHHRRAEPSKALPGNSWATLSRPNPFTIHQVTTSTQREAGLFLRSRRGQISPADLGLPVTNQRRVSGLRRDETAQLAGISVEYYVRLEQGRGGTPSDSVLTALARTFALTDAEVAHVRDLYKPSSPGKPAPEKARPGLRRMLDLIDTPALIFGRRTDILAWNRGAAALLTDFGALPAQQRNLARLVMLDDGFTSLMADWEQVARETVGILRMAAGRYPDDPRLAALIGELTVKSADFGRWWNARDVRQKTHGRKRMNHPQVGELDIAYETFRLPDAPDQTLVTYFAAEPASRTETALKLLDSWTGSPAFS